MAVPIPRVASTTTGPSTPGRIARTRIRRAGAPAARAASTYSRSDSTTVTARTTLAYWVQNTAASATVTLPAPDPSAATSANARMMGGKPRNRSTTRISTASVQPLT